jgi:hypothetical protein
MTSPDLSAEMAYVSYHDSCQDPCVDATGWLRECRRLRGHDGQHASDYPLYVWGTG